MKSPGPGETLLREPRQTFMPSPISSFSSYGRSTSSSEEARRLDDMRGRLAGRVADWNELNRTGPASMGADQWNSLVSASTKDEFQLGADIRAFNDAVRAYNDGSASSGGRDSGAHNYDYAPPVRTTEVLSYAKEKAEALAGENERLLTLKTMIDDGKALDAKVAKALTENWPRIDTDGKVDGLLTSLRRLNWQVALELTDHRAGSEWVLQPEYAHNARVSPELVELVKTEQVLKSELKIRGLLTWEGNKIGLNPAADPEYITKVGGDHYW